MDSSPFLVELRGVFNDDLVQHSVGFAWTETSFSRLEAPDRASPIDITLVLQRLLISSSVASNFSRGSAYLARHVIEWSAVLGYDAPTALD